MAQSGGEAPLELDPSKKHVVEDFKFLADSVLWDLLANYYKRMALDAWSSNSVPMFVTSHSRFAKNYADIFFAFLRDWFNRSGADRSTPVYLIEVGGGHGRFSYLFLRHLLRTRPIWEQCGIPEKPFVYVFSDVAKDNVAAIRKHPRLQEFVDQGFLDFAFFDANIPPADSSDGSLDVESIDLQVAGKPIPRNSPLTVICNYVLDSLLTEGYKLEIIENSDAEMLSPSSDDSGPVRASVERRIQLSRAQLAIYSPQEEKDPTDPSIIARMSLGWRWIPLDIEITPAEKNDRSTTQPLLGLQVPLCPPSSELKKLWTARKQQIRAFERHRRSQQNKESEEEKEGSSVPGPMYLRSNAKIRRVIAEYAALLEDVPGYNSISFVLPVGAFMLMEYLAAYSGQQLLMMVGDKGYCNEEEFMGSRFPHIAIHGSVSFMVNLDSLQKFTGANTPFGFSVATPFRDTFQLAYLFAIESADAKHFPITLATINSRLPDLAPDSLIQVQRHFQDHSDIARTGPGPQLKGLLGLLRYSGHDAEVFFNLRREFVQQCNPLNLNPRLEADIIRDLTLVMEHYFPLNEQSTPALSSESSDESRAIKNTLVEPPKDVEKDTEKAEFLESLAQIAMKLGRLDKAIEFFKMMDRDGCSNSAAYVNLAACLKALTLYEEATFYVDKALSLSPTFKAAKDLALQIKCCKKPLKLAIVGCGEWASGEAAFALMRDGRVIVRAIVGMQPGESETLLARLKLNPSIVRAIDGLTGLESLLSSDEIDGCVLDVSAKKMETVVPTILKHKKHILSRGVLSTSTSIARQLLQDYLASDLVHWQASSQEDVVSEARDFLRKSQIGRVVSVNVIKTFVTKKKDGTEEEAPDLKQAFERLSSELGAPLALLRRILAPLEPRVFSLKSSNGKAAAGWGSFELSPTLSQGSIARKPSPTAQLSLLVVGDTFESSCEILVRGESGSLRLQTIGASWRVTQSLHNSPGGAKEAGVPVSALINSLDSWLERINEEANPLAPRRPNIDSVMEAMSETAVVEALRLSLESGGAGMELQGVESVTAEGKVESLQSTTESLPPINVKN